MNDQKLTQVATFSMILAFVISRKCKDRGIVMGEFYSNTGISQPSWSRLSRGQTRFDIEDLKMIEFKTGFQMEKLISEAKILEQQVKLGGVEIIEPYTTKSKSDLESLGKAVVAVAVLAFLANLGKK